MPRHVQPHRRIAGEGHNACEMDEEEKPLVVALRGEETVGPSWRSENEHEQAATHVGIQAQVDERFIVPIFYHRFRVEVGTCEASTVSLNARRKSEDTVGRIIIHEAPRELFRHVVVVRDADEKVFVVLGWDEQVQVLSEKSPRRISDVATQIKAKHRRFEVRHFTSRHFAFDGRWNVRVVIPHRCQEPLAYVRVRWLHAHEDREDVVNNARRERVQRSRRGAESGVHW